MRASSNLFRILALSTLVMACSSSDPPASTPNPKAACDKLSSCSLSSSGFSCDSTTASDCAVCLNESTCADISAGKCAARCPGATFKPK